MKGLHGSNPDDLPYRERPKGPPPKLGDRRITKADKPLLVSALDALEQHQTASGRPVSPFWREKARAGYLDSLKEENTPQRLPSAPDRVPTKRPQDVATTAKPQHGPPAVTDWNPGSRHD